MITQKSQPIGIGRAQGSQAKPPINITFNLSFPGALLDGTGIGIVHGPDFVVPNGAAVFVRGVGPNGINGTLVCIATTPRALAGVESTVVVDGSTYAPSVGVSNGAGGVQIIAPNTQVGFPCSNLNQLWAAGSCGYDGTWDGETYAGAARSADGIQISILG